jgi:predicted transcriptional regulator
MPTTLTLEEWEQTLADFSRTCAYCLVHPFETLDHFYPVAIAGTVAGNCVPACWSCNCNKRDLVGEKLINVFGKDTISRVQRYLESRGLEVIDFASKSELEDLETKYILLPKGDEDIEGRKTYTIDALFRRLTISVVELAAKSDMSPSTAAGIRDGKTARLHTINRLLATFSELYEIDFTTDNVKGLNVLKGRYGEKREAA